MEERHGLIILTGKSQELILQVVLPFLITPVMLRRQLSLPIIAPDAERLLKHPRQVEVMIPLMDLPALSQAAVKLRPYPLRLRSPGLYLDLPHATSKGISYS